MAENRKVKWAAHAFSQFEKVYYYLQQFDDRYAEKVRLEIFKKVEQVSRHPEHYSLEKYKTDNDGSYRYFELLHIRISFRLIDNEIRIVRVRHTKMQPQNF